MTGFKLKLHSIRFKLIAGLISVCLFMGLVSLLVGGNLLYQSVLDEVTHRIGQDLNVARVIYDDRVASVRLALEMVASHSELPPAFPSADSPFPLKEITPALASLDLDFLWMVDVAGDQGQAILSTPLVARALETGETAAGTVVLSPEQLAHLAPGLRARADIGSGGTTSGLIMGAAVPILAKGQIRGLVYGGYLLNRDQGIVDKIGETVFRNEIYKGRRVGNSTIFLGNVRISTNVTDHSGKRAIGTVASPEVAHRVLDEGRRWTDRAKVLDEWYITAYEPIIDVEGRRVGMFYVGVLEAKYLDVGKRALVVFVLITLAGTVVAIFLGWVFTGRIIRPVSGLIKASQEISKGNLSPDIGPVEPGDIGLLQKNFKTMAKALENREKRQKVKSQIQLLQSEKQASIGKLAAGVAHEINNPLTAVLTFSHLMLRRSDLDEGMREDLGMIASQTERVRKIVRSLLNFSRQSNLAPEKTDVNALISESVRLMKNQALIKGIDLTFDPDELLPDFILDRNQIQSVMINMILNALDATTSGGKIAISVRKVYSDDDVWARIRIADTGCGIPKEHLNQLFDPFFTTKDIGKGTGLGLAVSFGIIQRHGGTIEVVSEPGEGTRFTIRLPRDP